MSVMVALVTPHDVEGALRRAPAEYKRMHEMNAKHELVAGCRLGTVFMWRGDYYVYVGVNGRNRKLPCIAERVESRTRYKLPHSAFDHVRRASENDHATAS